MYLLECICVDSVRAGLRVCFSWEDLCVCVCFCDTLQVPAVPCNFKLQFSGYGFSVHTCHSGTDYKDVGFFCLYFSVFLNITNSKDSLPPDSMGFCFGIIFLVCLTSECNLSQTLTLYRVLTCLDMDHFREPLFCLPQ